jgi:hypothetical protein
MTATDPQQMILRLLKELQAAHPGATRKELAKLLAKRIGKDDDVLTAVAKFLVSGIRKSEMN